MRPEEGFEYAHLALIRSVGIDKSCIIAHLSRTFVVIAVVVVVVVCCCCSSFLLLLLLILPLLAISHFNH